MKYRIFYFFLFFFKTYNYLPAKLKLQYYHYTGDKFWKYFFGSLLKRGFHLQIFLQFNLILNYLWRTLKSESKLIIFQYQYIFIFQYNIFYFFKNFNFIFYYYYQRVNKKIYKYSRYKVNRFNLKFFYIPKYRRFRLLITFVLKSINYERGRSFLLRYFTFLINFFFVRSTQFFYKYIYFLQKFIFKNYRKTLFMLSRYKI